MLYFSRLFFLSILIVSMNLFYNINHAKANFLENTSASNISNNEIEIENKDNFHNRLSNLAKTIHSRILYKINVGFMMGKLDMINKNSGYYENIFDISGFVGIDMVYKTPYNMINPFIGAEVEYHYTTPAKYMIDDVVMKFQRNQSVNFRFGNVFIASVGNGKMEQQIIPFMVIGFDVDKQTVNTDNSSIESTKIPLKLGFGLDYVINNSYGIRIDYNISYIKHDIFGINTFQTQTTRIGCFYNFL